MARQQLSEDQLYTRRFSSLSSRDLLDARDAYHVHLAHKPNVIATAIGLYLIRNSDADFQNANKTREAAKKRGTLPERTLENAQVLPWSWPCVLVFVSEWVKEEEMHKHPEHVVPPFLYLSDGRIVPVCVVKANHAQAPMTSISPAKLETAVLCGGSPIFAEAQGQRRMGSVGCIVTDGTEYYALTNRHVAGEAGREIRASFQGLGRVVGITEGVTGLGTVKFSDVYPDLPGRDTYVNLDAGLVKLNNVSEWGTGISGYKEKIGPLLDFSGETASLDWIGTRVVAHGAYSGNMVGEVRALFYRYKTVGGREYISDFLIGSRSPELEETKGKNGKESGTKAAKNGSKVGDALATAPGDSGTLWCLDPDSDPSKRLRPIAMQWGGQKLSADAGAPNYTQFALASSVALITRELGLDIVQDWTSEHVQYWGAVGHFKIAQQACFHVKDQTLKKFLQDNLNSITFSDDTQLVGATHLNALSFVPLSDVPDIVWKTNVNRVKRDVTRPLENPNHYADVDLPGQDGKTLLDLCGSPANLDLQGWIDFYASAQPPKASPPDKSGNPPKMQHGCLPFRVWQIFGAMQQFAAAGDVEEFLCAAGVIAHYAGDSCQPLHSSQHSDGMFGASTGVHSTYEEKMVDRHADDIANGVDQVISDNGGIDLIAMTTAKQAGEQCIELMRRCHDALSPETICDSYNQARGGIFKSPTNRPDVLDAMWHDLGAGTCKCIADGIRVLASIWESAFQSAKDTSAFSGQIDQGKLQALYEKKDFLTSRHLEQFTSSDLPVSVKKAAGGR
jgi:hypothetical protein